MFLLLAILAMLQQPAGPTGFDFPLVTALTAFIALPVKVLVDVVKGVWKGFPGDALPLVGIVLAYGFSVVVLVAAKQPFDASVYAQCGIAAVGAQVGAMAVTLLQTRVNKVDEKIQAALDMPSTSNRADVDAKVKADAAKE